MYETTSKIMKKEFLYGNYIRALHDSFNAELMSISAQHNFELGNEFEIAICTILRRFLPNKFGICRGFVVSSDGETAGDDIIIYDQERFPTLRLLTRNDFSRLENIPIEAVYAYIEAKHTIDIKEDNTKCVFMKSFSQCAAVKSLCSRRGKMLLNQADPYLLPLTAVNANEDMPDFRNPVFGAILGRFVAAEGKRFSDPNEVNKALNDILIDKIANGADLIVGGEHNLMCPAYQKPGKEPKSTIFMLEKYNYGYHVLAREGVGFGIFLGQLFAALDWTRLGRMPWSDIINDAREDNYKPQGF
jgi:hypothetical protein